jgi:hypothetical protein
MALLTPWRIQGAVAQAPGRAPPCHSALPLRLAVRGRAANMAPSRGDRNLSCRAPAPPRAVADSPRTSDAATAEDDLSTMLVVDEFHEVEKLMGMRANVEGDEPVVEYRVKWKDGSADTW